MAKVWLMTGQVAALAFILSVGIAIMISGIRIVLRHFMRNNDDSQ